MKRCFKCLCEKPLSEFYKHSKMADGRLNKCVSCTLLDVKRHRQENLEQIRKYDKARASQAHRAAMSTTVNRVYRASHPERVRANNAVARAVRSGVLKRWPCEVCGNSRSVAHHPDYERPLLVTWLCQPHHKEAHLLSKEQ